MPRIPGPAFGGLINGIGGARRMLRPPRYLRASVPLCFSSKSHRHRSPRADPLALASIGKGEARVFLTHGERAFRFRHAPHLLQIVEMTDLGAEQMDDDIAAIDQHPVARGGALDAHRVD